MTTSLRHSLTVPFAVPFAVALVLGGCDRKSAQPMAPPPQEVEVVTLAPHAVDIHTSLPGRAEAFEIAQVRPQVSGVLQKRLFVEGSDVTVGQQLYQIDPSLYQASYDGARAQLAQAQAAEATAQAKLKRYTPLAAAHAVSQQDYDDAMAAEKEAKAQIAQAQAQVETASVNLSYTHMNAPISGRIGRSLITVGALVAANQDGNVAVVTRLDPIYVDVNLPATTLLRLRRELASGRLRREGENATNVTLTLEDGSTYEHIGRMELTEVNVDPATGTVVVRAVIPNPDKLLLPGMYLHAELQEGTEPNALLVPQQAITRNSHGDPQALVVNADNKVELRAIQTQTAIGADWLVTQGLKAGEHVIVSGLQKVHPGDAVRPKVVELSTDAQPAPTQPASTQPAPPHPAQDAAPQHKAE